MNDNALKKTFIPELGAPRSGKVREIYEGEKIMLLIASDRISAFNRLFEKPIPDKGRILNAISKFWFDQTADIIQNHLLDLPDPNVMVVKKCKPLPIEVVVRHYIAGSLGRDYAKGKRMKCGVPLPDGLSENAQLPTPIITPTMKDKEDTEITAEELIEQGLISRELWNQITDVALKLFERGTTLAKKRGLVLVDTKYEFGLDEKGNLILIDEIHTPDSSRFWYDEKHGFFFDKEFIRKWLMENGQPDALPDKLVEEARQNYIKLYETILQRPLDPLTGPASERVIDNLVRAGLIHGFFVVVIGDQQCDLQDVPHTVIPNDPAEIQRYDASLEPIIMVSSHPIDTKWPVFAPDENIGAAAP